MTPEQHARIKQIVIAACELPESQRSAFVDEACGADAALRDHVHALLAHVSAAGGGAQAARDVGDATKTHTPAQEDEFAPGQIVAERYRIVTLIGRGGMGAVYRAEDQRLGQSVALKFLPAEFARDAGWLGRLHQEVRIARSITSPFLCRVHDVVDHAGGTFLTMEYIDGEDLRSLLKRIGRLPHEKAVEIACEICFGLAAAHAKGVLHRDLKPANILIDGRGHAHITDFGLSAIREDIPVAELRAGTPAYMAPEQMRGTEVSVRSDIYSLGLVLYELFVGRPAFTAREYSDIAAQKHESHLTPPSQIVPDIDSAIESMLLRCLAPDPADRPESALAVAAVFFRGDRLAAALAAGFVPTPDDVASGGPTDSVPKGRGFLQIAALIALLFACLLLSPLTSSAVALRPTKAPAALVERARAVLLEDLKLPAPREEAWGYCEGRELVQADVRVHAGFASELYALLSSNTFVFWYRTSETPLTPRDAMNRVFKGARLAPTDPPLRPGSTIMIFDPGGQLVGFERIPHSGESAPGGEFDWTPLLARHGLDVRSAEPIKPGAAALVGVPFDTVRAWRLGGEASTAPRLTVEVAELANQPVFLAVLSGDPRPATNGPWGDSDQRRWFVDRLVVLLTVALVLASIPLLRSNLAGGRSDSRGALRLAAFVFILRLVIWLLWARHAEPFFDWLQSLLLALSGALLAGSVVWLFYMALEPFVRRTWPHTLISATRVLQGRGRDPLVGRDLLTGVLLGALWSALMLGESALATYLFAAQDDALRGPDATAVLLGGRAGLGFMVNTIWLGLYNSLFLLLGLTALRYFLRPTWLSMLVAGILLAVILIPRGAHPLTASLAVGGLIVSLLMTMRTHGILALSMAVMVFISLLSFPLTMDTRAWYADAGFLVVALCLAVALSAYALMRAESRQRAI